MCVAVLDQPAQNRHTRKAYQMQTNISLAFAITSKKECRKQIATLFFQTIVIKFYSLFLDFSLTPTKAICVKVAKSLKNTLNLPILQLPKFGITYPNPSIQLPIPAPSTPPIVQKAKNYNYLLKSSLKRLTIIYLLCIIGILYIIKQYKKEINY